MNRTLWFVWLFTLLWVLVWPASVYNDLPDQLATHFNIHGEPDAYTDKQQFLLLWFALVIFINGIMLAVTTLVWKYLPHTVNIPNRRFWLSTAERKEQARLKVRTGIAMIATACNLLFLFVFQAILHQAMTGEPEANLKYVIGGFMIAMIACIGYFLLSFRLPDQSQPNTVVR